MKNLTNWLSSLTISLGCVMMAFASEVRGHNVEGVVNESRNLSKDESLNSELDATLHGIINGAKVWETGTPVEVCFMDGDSSTQSFVLETIADWEHAAPGLSFDGKLDGEPRICSDETADIRVSFESQGNWSFVGRDASSVSAKRPTLNIAVLRGALTNRKKKETRGTVLHEFGHALGMYHEHQHPDSNCEAQLNWDVVYEKLGAPPNSWSKTKVDRNIRSLTKKRYDFSPYDRESVMHYELPALFFFEGRKASCYVQRGNTLSKGDKELISLKYPENSNKQDDYFQSLKEFSQEIAGTLEQEKGRQFVEAFNKALPKRFTSQFGGIAYQGSVSVDIKTRDNIGGAILGTNSGSFTINNENN